MSKQMLAELHTVETLIELLLLGAVSFEAAMSTQLSERRNI